MVKSAKNVFPNVPKARYNVAVWQRSQKDHVVLVAREVEEPGQHGEPDKGKLLLVEIDANDNVVNERVIWEPKYGGIYLEDPRALVLPRGNLSIGLTAVIRTNDGYMPFPALVRIHSHDTWEESLPPITLLQTFGPGKNLTPVDPKIYLFRPDDPEYNHKLLVFTYEHLLPQKEYDIEFPKNLDWAQWRIGTTMSPLWMKEDEGLLIIHGITVREGKYIYSLGRARLYKDKSGKFNVDVAENPILTPDDFVNEKGENLVEELHPNLRRVVYACGGVIKRQDPDTLYLYVNVGDRATFEVGFDLNELKKGLFD